eukprot:jgi/Tetstr1/430044/TSEL_019905.t1
MPARPAHDYDGGGGGGHNIWYHNKKRERRPRGVRAPTRCVISRDAGRTRADWAGIQQLCVYFAQGCCTAGQNCTFLHRAPTEQDAVTLEKDHSRDCFGRDRGRDDKDDRGGVGSAMRDCRTLFVHYGGAGKLSAAEVQRLASENFGEWGRLHKVHVVPAKALVFVSYEWRCNAEFAKEAMQAQGFYGSSEGEVLEIKWANDDPNPGVVRQVKRSREELFVRAVQDEVARLPEDRKQARILQMSLAATGAYPDTDAQYNIATLPGVSTYAGPSVGVYVEPPPPPVVEEDDISRYLPPDDDAHDPYYDYTRQGAPQVDAGSAAPGVDPAQGGRPEEANEVAATGQHHGSTTADGAAQHALGLLAGYGSDADSD